MTLHSLTRRAHKSHSQADHKPWASIIPEESKDTALGYNLKSGGAYFVFQLSFSKLIIYPSEFRYLLFRLTSSVCQTNICGEIKINLPLPIGGKYWACCNHQFAFMVTFLSFTH